MTRPALLEPAVSPRKHRATALRNTFKEDGVGLSIDPKGPGTWVIRIPHRGGYFKRRARS
jgi:hypothetical protein